jgi:hypothetical protein
MNNKLGYFVLISFFYLLSIKVSANFLQNKGIKAYLTISFQNSKVFNDSSSQSKPESGIKSIFVNDGIIIIPEEKQNILEEYKLCIYVTINDSAIVEAKSLSNMGALTMLQRYPRLSILYANEKDIYEAVKKM